MNKEIKEIVEKLEINELREDYYNNQRKILELKYQMNRMTFNINVGRYAWYLSWINYFFDDLDDPKKSKLETYKKIHEYLIEAGKLEVFPEVREYMQVREEYERLLNNHAYYQTINIDLREELKEHVGVPRIYVRQHVTDFDKNIVDKDNELDQVDLYFLPYTTIYPDYKMKSKRDYRHFYNRTSFRYLEQLTQDCDYSLDNKRLGKVKIETHKCRY